MLSTFFLIGSGLYGQDYLLDRIHLNTTDGLSHNAMRSCYEDSRGLFWFTTRFGVNRFDGTDFKTYTRHQNGLYSNGIEHVFEDQDEMIWMLSGLSGYYNTNYFRNYEYCIFNPYTEKSIDTKSYLPEKLVHDLANCNVYTQLANKSLIFVSQDGYLLQYNNREDFRKVPIDLHGYDQVCLLMETVDGLLRLGLGSKESYKEDLVIDLSRGRQYLQPRTDNGFPKYPKSDGLYTKAGKNWFLRFEDTAGRGGYYTWLSGVIQQEDIIDIRDQFPEIDSLDDLTIRYIDTDRARYWVGHGDELLVLETGLGLVGRFEDVHWTTYIRADKQGDLILLDRQNGIYRYKLSINHFKRSGATGFPHRGIGLAQEEGKLWVGIDKEGYRFNLPVDLSTVHIVHNLAVEVDQAGNLWTGVISNLVPETDETTRALVKTNPEGIETIYELSAKINTQLWVIWEHPSDGYIWLASVDGTIIKLDPVSGENKVIPLCFSKKWHPNIFVYSFTLSEDQSIWMSTSIGLFHLNNDGELISQYSTSNSDLPGDDIHHCHIDDEGIFWLSTGDAGLLKWHPDKRGLIKQYTISEGLPSMVVHATYEDEMGNFWLPTENGIVQFNPESEVILTYGEDEGSGDVEFNRTSHYKDEQGNLYFGGMTGVTVFNPLDITDNQQLEISDQYIIPVDLMEYDVKLDGETNKIQDLRENGSIEITSDRPKNRLKLLSLAEQNLSYILLSQLTGLQNNPKVVKNNEIELNSLPYGSNELVITARDISGNILQKMTIPVFVRRPYYLTSWFFVLFFSLLSFLIYVLYGIDNRRLRKIVFERTQTIEKDKQTIEHQAAELRKQDELKTRFFTNVSHEIRTPLTLIKGPIRKILQSPEFPKDMTGMAESIDLNLERLMRLVNSILDLSRLDEDHIDLKERPILIKQYFEDIREPFKAYAASEDITLLLETESLEKTQLEIDVEKLDTILLNLLSNAIKYSSEGEIVTLRAKYDEMAGALSIDVIDQGMGIASENLPYIFNRYYQASNSESSGVGGTGIGLALCKKLTLLMNGEITVKSEIGKGCKFTLYLPAKIVTTEADAIINSADLGVKLHAVINKESLTVGTETSGGGQRILIVEDNRDLCRYLEQIIGTNYLVHSCENGLEAMKFITQSKREELPDLIITDLMMPEMDGFELLNQLKSRPHLSAIPIIVLSARATIDIRLKALRIGIDDYLVKPFDEEELLLRVKNLLGNAVVRKQLSLEVSGQENAPVQYDAIQDPETIESLIDTSDEWIAKVADLTRKQIKYDHFGNESLANELNMSPRTLSRKIQAVTGLSTNKFILEIRMQEARTILEEHPQITIAALADDVGFRKASYFSTKFKERFGSSPANYHT